VRLQCTGKTERFGTKMEEVKIERLNDRNLHAAKGHDRSVFRILCYWLEGFFEIRNIRNPQSTCTPFNQI